MNKIKKGVHFNPFFILNLTTKNHKNAHFNGIFALFLKYA